MLPPALLGLTAMIFAHATAIPLLQVRQDGACTVLIGSCNDQNIELDLTECACACLQNSCELIGGCDNEEGTPFKGNLLGGAFQDCIKDSSCAPVFAEGQELDPSLINCQR
ncbi:hypothetical protein VUR80DRAFT_395 [Thermomyces stellatus]